MGGETPATGRGKPTGFTGDGPAGKAAAGFTGDIEAGGFTGETGVDGFTGKTGADGFTGDIGADGFTGDTDTACAEGTEKPSPEGTYAADTADVAETAGFAGDKLPDTGAAVGIPTAKVCGFIVGEAPPVWAGRLKPSFG